MFGSKEPEPALDPKLNPAVKELAAVLAAIAEGAVTDGVDNPKPNAGGAVAEVVFDVDAVFEGVPNENAKYEKHSNLSF